MHDSSLASIFKKASPESGLLLALIQIEHGCDVSQQVAGLLEKDINWEYFLSLTVANEVLPSAYQTLKDNHSKEVPKLVMDVLQNSYAVHEHRNKILCNELVWLNNMFADNGISIINYKGPETTARIEGNITTRQYNDLDFLIHTEQLAEVFTLLDIAGYQTKSSVVSGLPRKDFVYFRRATRNDLGPMPPFPHKDPNNDNGRILIEPHMAFIEHRFPLTIDYKGIWKRSLNIEQMGISIPSLSKEDLIFILCLCGCKAQWKNLKLIASLTDAINAFTDIDWELCLNIARKAGGERMILLGVLLASELLAAKTSVSVLNRANADIKLVALAKIIAIRRSRFSSGPVLFPFPWRYSPIIMGVLDQSRNKRQYAWRTLTTPYQIHFKYAPLPKALHFLYPIIVPLLDYTFRPLLMLCKHYLASTFNKKQNTNNIGKRVLNDFLRNRGTS